MLGQSERKYKGLTKRAEVADQWVGRDDACKSAGDYRNATGRLRRRKEGGLLSGKKNCIRRMSEQKRDERRRHDRQRRKAHMTKNITT